MRERNFLHHPQITKPRLCANVNFHLCTNAIFPVGTPNQGIKAETLQDFKETLSNPEPVLMSSSSPHRETGTEL